jgi:acetoacetate decarboxylase
MSEESLSVSGSPFSVENHYENGKRETKKERIQFTLRFTGARFHRAEPKPRHLDMDGSLKKLIPAGECKRLDVLIFVNDRKDLRRLYSALTRFTEKFPFLRSGRNQICCEGSFPLLGPLLEPVKGMEAGMLHRNKSFIILTCICAILMLCTLGCATREEAGQTTGPREDFVPNPVFSPPYPSLPHHFSDVHTIQILCQAPKDSVQKALAKPLTQAGDGDKFILLLAWTPDVEKQGYNVHEIAINAPVQWNDNVGNTTLIEYIDSDMGLIAGREIYGWPKKMAIINWTQTETGWTVTANKMQDQGGILLMKVEYTISDSAPEVEWPSMSPTYLVRRIPPASLTTPSINQMVCVGCNMPKDQPEAAAPLVAQGARNETRGTATVEFFDGPHDPLTFLGPIKVLDAKMSIMEGEMPGGLGLGEVLSQWEE